MAVTETTTVGWGSRLGSSVKGVLFGILMFLAGFPVLFWNEGNTVKTRKALDEGQGACVAVESNAKVDADLDGKLVHMTGTADTKDVLTDAAFGVQTTAIRLARKVEMYQWVEESHTKEEKKLGGKIERTTTYTYKQEWRAGAVDSSNFKEAGHANPPAMEFGDESQLAKNVTFGAYRLSESQISSIGRPQPYAFPTNYVCPVGRCVLNGSVIYVPNAETRKNEKNTRDVVAMPRVGDMRVTITQILPHKVSLVAKTSGDTFGPYVAKNGKKVQMLSDGEKTMEEMFASAQSANTTMCWIIRIVGLALMFFGLSAVLRPLSVLADVLPILGDIVGVGTGLVAGVLALVCGLTTIAIAWIFYRPVLGVCLLAAAGGLVYLLMKKRAAAKLEKKA